jgi:urease accessory protein
MSADGPSQGARPLGGTARSADRGDSAADGPPQGARPLGGTARSADRGDASVAPQALVRLLQLASPALPIGGYSYSQGLEAAVEAGTVHDAPSAQRWIADVLELAIAVGDAPVLWRLCKALSSGDAVAFGTWNTWFLASRETAELRAETEQMGGSLAKLIADLPLPLVDLQDAAYALAAHAFGVACAPALTGYLWSWLENQVIAAMKLVPLGQVAGQRMLLALGEAVTNVAARAPLLADDDVASFAPGLALASSRHETQYSRLFRS